MATQPDTQPNRIEPQSPPEAPPQPAEPEPIHPEETPPLPPDIDQPGIGPDEQPIPL
jgi:hypothetical protein